MMRFPWSVDPLRNVFWILIAWEAGMCGASKAAEPTTVVAIVEPGGRSPEEVLQTAVAPAEAELKGLKGVRRIRSFSRPERGVIWIEFEPTTEVLRARQITAERLASISGRLPAGAAWSLPSVSQSDGEVVLVGVTSASRSQGELTRIAETELRGRLTTITGVTDVEIRGGARERCKIDVDFRRLRAYGIELQTIVDAVSKEGVVAVDRRAESPVVAAPLDDAVRRIGAMVVDMREGVPVRLSDVAQVELSAEQSTAGAAILETAAGADSRADNAVVLLVRFAGRRDIAAIMQDVAGVLETAKTNLPPDVLFARRVFEPRDFRMRLRIPYGSREMARIAEVVESMLVVIPELKALWRLPGEEQSSTTASQLDLYLAFARDATADRNTIRDRIYEAVRGAPGVDLRVKEIRYPRFDDPLDEDLVVAVSGADPAKVKDLASKCRMRLSALKQVVARFDEGLEPELRLEVSPERLAQYGAKEQACRTVFQAATRGIVVGRVASAGRSPVEVIIRAADPFVPNVLEELHVRGADGRSVPLPFVAKTTMVARSGDLYREDGRPTAVIECDLQSSDVDDAGVARIEEALKAMEWPEGYAWRIVRGGK